MTEQKNPLRSQGTANVPYTITKESRVTIGTLIVVITAAITGTYQWSSLGRDNDLRFQRMELKLEAIEETVKNGNTDRWQRHDMQIWVTLLKELNPDLKVPTVGGG